MSYRSLLICAVSLAAALSLSISGSSLWTDEAFSAWMASHESFRSLSQTLLTGGSSDLQMALYYIYLFLWAKLFGAGEIALRAANIPFILLFSFALVWSSWRIFRSRVAWLAAGMLPFVWRYASEARPYMALLAFGAVGLASVLAFTTAESTAGAKRYPWICLSCIFLGSLFDMLFLLLVAPMALILALAHRSRRLDPRWSYWARPLAVFALPFGALALYFLFTFYQGVVDYNYPSPGVRQMASVAFEIAGLSGFGPNRKLSLDFRAYAVPIALGSLAIGSGAFCAAYSALRTRRDHTVAVLAAAACLCAVEAVALALAIGKQEDARHLAAMVPVFLSLLMALARGPAPRASVAALILLGGAWFAADLRAAFLPEYQKEDYRDAVHAALALHQQIGGEIVVAGDPVAAAYYGLDVRGRAPCYPIQADCGAAFQSVHWSRKTSASNAGHWAPDYIRQWLAAQRARGIPVEILVPLDRARRNSGWWPVLASGQVAARKQVHGFEIVVLKDPKPLLQPVRRTALPATVW